MPNPDGNTRMRTDRMYWNWHFQTCNYAFLYMELSSYNRHCEENH